MGIGPTRPAWKAGILPLNYTRIEHAPPSYRQRLYIITRLKRIVKYFSGIFRKFFLFFQLFFTFVKILKKCYLFAIFLNTEIFFSFSFFIFSNVLLYKYGNMPTLTNEQKSKTRFKQQDKKVDIQNPEKRHQYHQ